MPNDPAPPDPRRVPSARTATSSFGGARASPPGVEELFRRPATEAFAGVRAMHISRSRLFELTSHGKLDDAIALLVRVRCGRPEKVHSSTPPRPPTPAPNLSHWALRPAQPPL